MKLRTDQIFKILLLFILSIVSIQDPLQRGFESQAYAISIGQLTVPPKSSFQIGISSRFSIPFGKEDFTAPRLSSSGTGGSNIFLIDIDYPRSKAEVKSSVSAFDAGDKMFITPVLTSDTCPTSFTHENTCKMTFTATDSSGNTGSLELTVISMYFRPLVSLATPISTTYYEKLELEQITNYLVVTNYDETSLSEYDIVIVDDQYSSSFDTLGEHSISLKVTTETHTSDVLTFNILVTDDLPPVLLVDLTLSVNPQVQISEKQIKSIIEQENNIILNDFIVIRNTYKDNYQTPGEYEMLFSFTNINSDTQVEMLKIIVLGEEDSSNDDFITMFITKNTHLVFVIGLVSIITIITLILVVIKNNNKTTNHNQKKHLNVLKAEKAKERRYK